MRHGFTTGSCSAAAAKAATYMLLSGKVKNSIVINTPSGIAYEAKVEEISIYENQVSCAVVKDGGDDPDITSGSLIFATVSFCKDICQIEQEGLNSFANENVNVISLAEASNDNRKVIIDGGEGVGRVTRPGLDQPVGNAAINSVPRQMIENEVTEVMDLFDCKACIKVIISVPGGRELAEKTFNPRLGIEGGISIIGTSGIVEPMSTKAILDTIRVELNQRKEEGHKIAIVSPGNYGLDFMKQKYNFDLDKAVKCSNFLGETIDIVKALGFEKMLLVGHMGKLIKLSGGIMNTHSKEADSRMELMAAIGIKVGISIDAANKILDSVTTEEAYGYICESNLTNEFAKLLMDKVAFYLQKRAGDMPIECIIYSNEYGLIGATKKAEMMIKGNV